MDVLAGSKCVFIIVAILVIPNIGMAQNPPAQYPPTLPQSAVSSAINPARIAFVGMQKVIATCDEGKDESAKFQQWAEKKRAEIQSLQKEIDTLKSRLDIQGSRLTEEARNDLASTIDTKEIALQRVQQDSQKEADSRRQRLTNAIYRKAIPVIAKLAKEKNLDSVFFLDQNRDAYINPSLVITDEVIKAYNADYPTVNLVQPIKK